MEAGLVRAMVQHLGPVVREAIAVRCMRIVVAAGAGGVAAVAVGGCILLFYGGEGMWAGGRWMYQRTVFELRRGPVDMLCSVQVSHHHTQELTSSTSNSSCTNFFGSTRQFAMIQKPEGGEWAATERRVEGGIRT